MLIRFVEISNFRKLLSIRVAFTESTTLFVGANNSGKTSAMLALRKFLLPKNPKKLKFEINDFTLCHWAKINAIGDAWIAARKEERLVPLEVEQWSSLVPTLDLWLTVNIGEFHHVRELIPTLDWEGGDLGVRLRFEPIDLQKLYADFLDAYDAAHAVRLAAAASATPAEGEEPAPFTVWPSNLTDYLTKRLNNHFSIQVYLLDLAKREEPDKAIAKPQALASGAQPVASNPLPGLIRVNDIPAQRGFGEASSGEDGDFSIAAPAGSRLSEQLRTYYKKHLDPTENPDPEDLKAIQAIEAAQHAFDARLTESFKAAFTEVEGMGYPGVSDPRPKVSTRIKAIDGLNHSAAVSFVIDVIAESGEPVPLLHLPEDNNGLGYQNLISMIFRLMGFRDGWMRVGKASKVDDDPAFEPLHLVLVEEPEAHLHAQVQQVFITKAYSVLRDRQELRDGKKFRTQLVVSTHSSHVAHEIPFSGLRYFRRLPAGMAERVPVSTVVNLSEVFGPDRDTERFVTRYLRAQHADLFFADAAILVEGPAEKIVLPNLIRVHHPFLNQCYLTLLEIGGSHAHKLRPLIEEIGLTTLIVTDIDSLDEGGKKAKPLPNTKQVTDNATLKTWLPRIAGIDELLAAKDEARVEKHDALFETRVAYQRQVAVQIGKAKPQVAFPYTFEDALVFENLAFFSDLEGYGLVRKFRESIASETSAEALGQKFFEALKDGKKAEFALDVIDAKTFDSIVVPQYIEEGLKWLEGRLKKKQVEVLIEEKGGEP